MSQSDKAQERLQAQGLNQIRGHQRGELGPAAKGCQAGPPQPRRADELQSVGQRGHLLVSCLGYGSGDQLRALPGVQRLRGLH